MQPTGKAVAAWLTLGVGTHNEALSAPIHFHIGDVFASGGSFPDG
jgi:hypothetical protein